MTFTALVPASRVLAHDGEPLAPHDVWSAWQWELLPGMALLVWLYLRGVAGLWRRAGRGRGVTQRQVTAFVAGMSILFVALVSPLDALSGVLFSAHMVQHLLLILIAVPLLIYGAPPVSWLWALPRRWRSRVGHAQPQRWLTAIRRGPLHPIGVWLIYAAAIWLWHLPALYQAALNDDVIHAVEHLTLIGAAGLFWWTLHHSGERGRLSRGSSILFVFTTMLHSTLLGVLITFATVPWYSVYADRTSAWGITPLADQQLAGGSMWVLAGFVYVGTTLALFITWLQRVEQLSAAQDEISQSAGGVRHEPI